MELAIKGQGFGGEDKQLIEMIAMGRARKYFKRIGKIVDADAYKTKPYDLECEIDGKTVYVEVKGTKGDYRQFILTNGEVKFANEHAGSMALFVVYNIDSRKAWDNNDRTKSFLPWSFNE